MAAGWLVFGNSSAQGAEVTVFKSPTCGCCSDWIQYLKSNGFSVKVQNASNLSAINAGLQIPTELQTCHTALIEGYVVEGHVPLEDIQRLLAERPAAAGIAVPGMPNGSPGMEQGLAPDRYDTILFAKNGSQEVWASH